MGQSEEDYFFSCMNVYMYVDLFFHVVHSRLVSLDIISDFSGTRN